VTHPAYEQLRPVLPQAAVVLQDNPGPMTLDGTNTWLLRAPGSSASIVVDPGDHGPAHLDAVRAAAGDIELVLITHGHHDHTGASAALHAATGAAIRAFDPQHCHGDAAPLADGEVVVAAGVQVQALHTPGHTADSVSFVLADGAAVLTGDTILGRGTTVVAHPDGVLGAYLDSLRRLRELGAVPVLPAHGPDLPSLEAIAAEYLAHRAQRLDQVRDALAELGAGATARQIVELVYADVDEAVWWAAELSVRAQLDYLRAG
jgi:glyoxylase-like metal-dependent hydrolase (beta-lactamase superfamily II)